MPNLRVQSTIPLTKNLSVDQGSHILYFYSSPEDYIDNLVSFILHAKKLDQKAIIIDSQERFSSVKNRLLNTLEEKEIAELVYFVSNFDFYEMYQDFHFHRVLENFKSTVQPFVDEDSSVRVWGHVDWKPQENMRDKLRSYESECDLTVNEIGYMTVCAYNGMEVPAYIQTEMLKSHEYFMTDDELVRSNLYSKTNDVVFPTISTQWEIESELDFYKKKLDFIHVVSHEVRNPLTVIKSFATILDSEIHDDRQKQLLQLIRDYSETIDIEINHIIQTEQMLTSDTLWKTKLINIKPLINETLDQMDVKARTQNIRIKHNVDIEKNLILKGNVMGIKLIFSNLISNAIKYSYEGESIYINVYQDPTYFIFEVKDHGVGMSDNQLEMLFRKYGKMNDERSGQGIGLFMVKKLTDYFKGEIFVTSKPGKGTTFIVKFPI